MILGDIFIYNLLKVFRNEIILYIYFLQRLIKKYARFNMLLYNFTIILKKSANIKIHLECNERNYR